MTETTWTTIPALEDFDDALIGLHACRSAMAAAESKKKADAEESPQEFFRVGLLFHQPLGTAKLLLISSSGSEAMINYFCPTYQKLYNIWRE